MGLFTQTPSTVEIGRTALRIISPGFVMSTVSVIASGAFEGLGMGLKSLKISLMRYAVIIIPIACVLSRIIILPVSGTRSGWQSLSRQCMLGRAGSGRLLCLYRAFLVSKRLHIYVRAKNVTVHICPVTWKVRKDCRCLTLLGICVK